MAGGAISSEPVALASATLEALRRIEDYAPARTPVVFVGDTGTGKSYFARWLHERSGRQGPFEDVTAGELSAALAQDQLMGHERGAFTGAVGRRVGLIAGARDGTLMIDDFHLLRRSVQHLLLRLLDRKMYRRTGMDRDIPVQCRLVVGIGADPDELVARGRILKDLRYRLGHCLVRIPPLDERREEIGGYASRFLAEAPVETGVADGPRLFGAGVVESLELAAWPGNVRDLRKTVEAAYLHARRSPVIDYEHLPVCAQISVRYDRRAQRATKLRLVAWALFRSGGKVRLAAELIGADRKTVAALRQELKNNNEEGEVASS